MRAILDAESGITEREMLGGLTFMLNGNMLGGPRQDSLIVRVGPDVYDDALARAETQHLQLGKYPMRGFVEIAVEHLGEDESLREWVGMAVDFAKTLPPK